mmetsp:Transcript_16621/g.33490  ORF Transcript_16621/g.33490 Transcript_16621/m.33490 type:complete len:305 (+) Transcript_16621:1993-2907(+)
MAGGTDQEQALASNLTHSNRGAKLRLVVSRQHFRRLVERGHIEYERGPHSDRSSAWTASTRCTNDEQPFGESYGGTEPKTAESASAISFNRDELGEQRARRDVKHVDSAVASGCHHTCGVGIGTTRANDSAPPGDRNRASKPLLVRRWHPGVVCPQLVLEGSFSAGEGRNKGKDVDGARLKDPWIRRLVMVGSNKDIAVRGHGDGGAEARERHCVRSGDYLMRSPSANVDQIGGARLIDARVPAVAAGTNHGPVALHSYRAAELVARAKRRPAVALKLHFSASLSPGLIWRNEGRGWWAWWPWW